MRSIEEVRTRKETLEYVKDSFVFKLDEEINEIATEIITLEWVLMESEKDG